jgi:hypothetical protein
MGLLMKMVAYSLKDAYVISRWILNIIFSLFHPFLLLFARYPERKELAGNNHESSYRVKDKLKKCLPNKNYSSDIKNNQFS